MGDFGMGMGLGWIFWLVLIAAAVFCFVAVSWAVE